MHYASMTDEESFREFNRLKKIGENSGNSLSVLRAGA